jgi:hypothetical protein
VGDLLEARRAGRHQDTGQEIKGLPRGELHGQVPLEDGKSWFVSFLRPLTPKGRRFEIAYPADEGGGWEANWIMVDTLATAVSTK